MTTRKSTVMRHAGGHEVRCSGKLVCSCGRTAAAGDFDLTRSECGAVEGVKLVCAGCHTDLVEVSIEVPDDDRV